MVNSRRKYENKFLFFPNSSLKRLEQSELYFGISVVLENKLSDF